MDGSDAVAMVRATADRIRVGLDPEAEADYVDICRINVGLMTWSMVLESCYGRPRSWVHDRLSDADVRRCAPDAGLTLHKEGGGWKIICHGGYRGSESVSSLLAFADRIDGDLYRVVSALGWETLCRLHGIVESFPFREYKTTRTIICGFLSDHLEDDADMRWAMDALSWLTESRPIIPGRVDSRWLESHLGYPVGFLTESYAYDTGKAMDGYARALEKMLSSMPPGNTRDGIGSYLRPAASDDGTCTIINSGNIGRWLKVIGRMTMMLDDDHVRGMLESVSDVPAPYNGFRIYPTIRKGIDDRMEKNMGQSDTVTLTYAEHASASKASMERWIRWIGLQGDMSREGIMVAYVDDRKLALLPYGMPTITSFPDGLARWLDDGEAPESLRMNPFTVLTIPSRFARRLSS